MEPAAPWILDAVTALARTAARGADQYGAVLAPTVEVTVDGDRVSFLFDYLLLFSAQSGSDWYEHHVVSGTARIAGDELVDVTTVEQLNLHLTEHEVEWAEARYDSHKTFREIAEKLRST